MSQRFLQMTAMNFDLIKRETRELDTKCSSLRALSVASEFLSISCGYGWRAETTTFASRYSGRKRLSAYGTLTNGHYPIDLFLRIHHVSPIWPEAIAKSFTKKKIDRAFFYYYACLTGSIRLNTSLNSLFNGKFYFLTWR